MPANVPDLSTPVTLSFLKKIIPSATARQAIHFRFEGRLFHREGFMRRLTWLEAFAFAFAFTFAFVFAFAFA